MQPPRTAQSFLYQEELSNVFLHQEELSKFFLHQEELTKLIPNESKSTHRNVVVMFMRGWTNLQAPFRVGPTLDRVSRRPTPAYSVRLPQVKLHTSHQ